MYPQHPSIGRTDNPSVTTKPKYEHLHTTFLYRRAGARLLAPRLRGQAGLLVQLDSSFCSAMSYSPSSSNRKWLLKSKAEAPSTLRDPLPAEIQFHEFLKQIYQL